MNRIVVTICVVFCLMPLAKASDRFELAAFERLEGFVDLYWDKDAGRLLLDVENLDEAFIYQASLARGVGSNDLGLDRGQLGATRVVRFIRSGPKILLVQDNLSFRAQSDNEDEKQAIAESFARSVLWGFEDIDPSDSKTVVDATSFFLSDTHGISARLAAANEGAYSIDDSRSAVFMPRTKSFPNNTEIEALVTFVGEPTGAFLPTVSPDATATTVHLHHSFIRLPDDGYEPMAYDPRSGVIAMRWDTSGFADYASAIGDSLTTRFGRRHRLQKKDPSAAMSEAVEPIIYYLDRGAPEPIRSALLEGARWWNQAFEAAGYIDAFQVQLLPQDADPMDVRYNVIQWVHRSTRGWSYGDSIIDPRTGEILKGHVSLGSLRVRQDYLIAEGLLSPYSGQSAPPEMLEMSLARIRQLSAHEVGHTIGFEHNFAASTQDRSSVMDYPVPLIKIRADETLDLGDAYGDQIGPWDKRTVLYAYQDYTDDVDADAARLEIMTETISAGFKYVADDDSRSIGTAHPDGNLWDNGEDAIAELEHLLRVRAIALRNFSDQSIRSQRPLATIEEALVPIYLLHRFQIQAVGKLMGGQYFNYNLRGDEQSLPTMVSAVRQQQAIDALLTTLNSEMLLLPETLVALIPPRPPGNMKSRETFSGATGAVFDAKAPAASAVAMTLAVMLEPSRAARLAQPGAPGFNRLVDALMRYTWRSKPINGAAAVIQRQTNLQVMYGLLQLALNTAADAEVRAIAMQTVFELQQWLSRQSVKSAVLQAHYRFARFEIDRLLNEPADIEQLLPVVVPPGSPIG